MSSDTTRDEYAAFRKKWKAARRMAARPLVVDLGRAPPGAGCDVDIEFDHGVDVEFDDSDETTT